MIYSFLFAVCGVAVLLGAWIGVQEWARRQTPECPPDCDMLEHLACDHCFMGDVCDLKQDKTRQSGKG